MKVFNYSNETGEFTGADEARESPREPGQPLIPAYATPDQVPAVQVGNVAVFLNDEGQVVSDYRAGAWREIADNRGMYFRTADAQPETLTDIGVLPADRGLTALVPPANAKWTGKKWSVDKDKVKALQNAQILAQIAKIEAEEQPAAQRKFALDNDNSLMRAVQEKIDALTAQLQS